MKKQRKRLMVCMMALVATTTSVWALETDGDGAYLIGSVQDWKDFATLVQSNPTANAKMTSDIDLGDDQTMIGTSAHPYQGTFNGQRHTLTVNLNTSLTNTAPFSYVGTGAVIKRLVIDGTIRSTAEYLFRQRPNHNGFPVFIRFHKIALPY